MTIMSSQFDMNLSSSVFADCFTLNNVIDHDCPQIWVKYSYDEIEYALNIVNDTVDESLTF